MYLIKKMMWGVALIFIAASIICLFVAFMLTAERGDETMKDWMENLELYPLGKP